MNKLKNSIAIDRGFRVLGADPIHRSQRAKCPFLHIILWIEKGKIVDWGFSEIDAVADREPQISLEKQLISQDS